MKKFFIMANAQSQNARKAESRAAGEINPNMPAPRGNQDMTAYYRNGGVSQLGATNRTKGRVAAIRPVRRRSR